MWQPVSAAAIWVAFFSRWQRYRCLQVGGSPPKFIDNVKAHLQTPGQFYFDKAGSSIYYLPLPAQDMS